MKIKGQYQRIVLFIVVLLSLLVNNSQQACHATCLLCDLDASANNCTSCDSSQFRTQTVTPSACSCIVGYIDAANTATTPTCISGSCSYTCNGLCQGSATVCTGCNGGTFRTLTGTACPCDTGYFDNSVEVCVACNTKCKSCSTSATTCTDCYNTQFRSLSGSACNCIAGYFDAGIDVCGACSYKCATCSGAASTCVTCAGGVTRSTTPTCNCVDKYYDDANSATCPSCDYSCATCVDGISCATCNAAKFRSFSSATNLCACQNGYFDAGTSTQLCSTCNPSCLTCSGSLNTNCVSCNSANRRILNSGTGKCDCSPGYYASSTTLCAACHATCQTCSGALSTNCLTCNSLLHRSTLSSNACPCDSGYYSNTNNVCTACHSSCATCASSTACAACPSATQIVSSSTGFCTCATTKYWDSVSSTCVACTSNCATCSITGSNCTSCNMATNKRVLTSNACICAVGYYDNGAAICAGCSYTCLACDSSGCLTCNATAKRTKTGTSCLCQQGFYDNGSTQLCLPCKNTCVSCTTSSTNCQSCDGTTQFRVLSGSSCICSPGYFDPNSGSAICQKCSNKCATCTTNTTNCVACAGTLSTRGASPGCACNAKYYDNGVAADCIACQYSCKTCRNSTACFNCDSTKFRFTDTTTGYCKCNIRYYDDGSNQLCVSCHQTCLTCTSSANTACLTCNGSSQRVFNSSTLSCDCMPKFYATSATVQLCAACHGTCLTCSGSTISSCVTCNSAQQRTFDGTNKCLCNDGFYLDASFVCQSCHSSCATCADSTACVTCPYATQIINSITGICQCASTQAWNLGTLACVACDSSCSTCSMVTTNCTSCDAATNFRTLSGSACRCLDGYYDNSVSVCVACTYQCTTCNIGGCLTCDSTAYRQISGINCNCMDRYYDDGSHKICKQCQYTCKTCTTSASCFNCDSVLFRVFDAANTFCACQTKYYQSTTTLSCLPCLYSCATCSVGNRCLTCTAGNFRFFNTTTTQCQCQVRYYDDGTHQLCNACLYDCLTCTDYSSCSTCDIVTDLRVFNAATSRCDCIQYYYQDSSPNPPICTSCHYSCLTCTSNTLTSCITCNNTAQRIKNTGTGKCDCKDGYYDDSSNQLCLICHYSCLTCSAAGTCATCDPGTLRSLSGTCICPALTYYDDGTNIVCLSCHYSCNTCTGPATCASCNSTDYFRTASATTQYCDCLPGYFDDGYNNHLCALCPYPCLTCNNPSSCLTCDSATNHRYKPAQSCICLNGYYDDGASHPICATCQYTCQTCIVGNQCITCNSLKFRTYNSANYLCDCITGYFDTGISAQLCQPCHYRCLTCQTSTTHCVTCNSTFHRTVNAVAHTCPCDMYYYDDLINPMCLSCHYSCMTCSNSLTCDTCDPVNHRQYDPNTDLCKCSIKFYDDGNNNQICNACHGSCLQCTNSSACTACDSSMLRLRNYTANYAGDISPYCICNYKYYPQTNLQDICLACHYTCAVCSGGSSTNCLFCTADAYRTFNSSTKTCPCNDGYFDNMTSVQTCLSCNPACTICTNSTTTQCTECAPTYYLKIDVTTCFTVCPSYFFGQNSTMTCKPCSNHCITCNSSSICTSCDVGFPLYQDECLSSCPVQSTFLDAVNNVCINCPVGCLTCTSSINCLSCVSNGYYLDAQLHLCFVCNQNCKGCLGPAQNQCLDCNYPLYFNNNQCFNISCAYGQYIDSHLGCLECKNLFSFSLTCSINQATLCQKLYKVKNGLCQYCTTVPGYTIITTSNNNQDCSQICGDGIVIEYQCDDGNNLDGDGCSSNCINQQGWHCVTDVNMKSICSIDGAIQMKLQRIYKYGGDNKIKLYITLSMPIRLSSNYFILNIVGVSTSSYSWQFVQLTTSLTNIQFIISYAQSIDGKNIIFNYNTSISSSLSSSSNYQSYDSLTDTYNNNVRLLQSNISLTFNEQFSISSYPPAIYYSDTQITSYNNIKNGIFVCSIILLILSGVCLLFPKKMYIHIIGSVCLPAQIFIYYGLVAERYTDWIKWSLDGLYKIAFIGGFIINQQQFQGTVTQHYGYSYYITINMGITGCIVLGLWLIYGLAAFSNKYICKNRKTKKIIMYLRYIILTLQLCLIPHISYSAINALYNTTLTSQTSSINVCLAIFINIYLLGLISIIFMLSSNTKPNQLMQLSQLEQYRNKHKKIYGNSQNQSIQDNVSDNNNNNRNRRLKNNQFDATKQVFFPQLDKDNIVGNNVDNSNNNKKMRVYDNQDDRSQRQTQKIQFQSSRSELQILQQRHSRARSRSRDNLSSANSMRKLNTKDDQNMDKNDKNNGQKEVIQDYDALGYWYNNIQVYHKIQQSYLPQWLVYDYVQLYAVGGQKYSRKLKKQSLIDNNDASQLQQNYNMPQSSCQKYSFTRYYLPVTLLKIYLLSLISSVVQSQLFILYLILGGISIIYILYIIVVRPFRFMFSNMRVILVQIGIAAANGVMAYYMYCQNYGLSYQHLYQLAVLYIIVITLATSIFLLVLEALGSWRMEIWNKLEPCLVAMRLRGARKVMSYKKVQRKPKIQKQAVQIKKQQEKQEQMDAFFARMLNKQAVEKQYRRQRLMKKPKILTN